MAGFGGKLTELLNASATSTALGVASRTGLLAALGPEPQTSAALAARAGITARWADEILAVLVCGDVVVLSDPPVLRPTAQMPEELKYSLPDDRKGALDGMGLYFEELPLLSQCAFSEVCHAAVSGSGVAPDRYKEFGAWMGKLADEKHARQLTQKFLPALDDGKIAAALERGARVLDLGCGEGTAARIIAAAFPAAEVVGVDISEASVAAARSHPDATSLQNLQFRVGDASNLVAHAPELAGQFDLVLSFDAIHDLPDPSSAMGTARALLTPDGIFAMVDIRAQSGLRGNLGHDMGAFLYCVSLMHCMPQGLGCDCHGRPGAGLGMMWGRSKAQHMLKEVGFDVQVVELEFDQFNDVFLCRASPSTGRGEQQGGGGQAASAI